MKVIAVVQARVGSSRLPNKVLKKLGETTVLDYVVSRAKKISGIERVVVATTILPKDDKIIKWCLENKIDYVRGSESNVLSRFIEVAEKYTPDYIIRITSDCPFLDYKLGSDLVELIENYPVDIVDLSPNVPRGIIVEMVSVQALKRIWDKEDLEERHLEHVTYYAYEYREQFTRVFYEVNKNLQHPELRLTIDTEEDYELCLRITEEITNKYINTEEIIQYLYENKDIALINKHIKQKEVRKEG